MTSTIQAIILGIIQGVTEWLPISSSGHLVLAEHLFGIEEPVAFDVMLHLGSVFVIILVFWKDIIHMLKKPDKSIVMLLIATLPIALVGFFLNDLIKSLFTLKTTAFCWIATSFILFLSRYPKRKDKPLTLTNTFLIGIFQALAILPGISRSGSTISAGLIQGVKREDAARFSFLLAIPAILGASVLESGGLLAIGNIPALAIGTIFSMVVGYITLKLLLVIINKDLFSYFSVYCLLAGIITLSFL